MQYVNISYVFQVYRIEPGLELGSFRGVHYIPCFIYDASFIAGPINLRNRCILKSSV